MPYLLDTGTLLRFAQPGDPAHAAIVARVQALTQAGETLHITAQNLMESWNVATRPVANGGLGTRASREAAL